jgi:branched-chain amino acid transport system substrate-binding protein
MKRARLFIAVLLPLLWALPAQAQPRAASGPPLDIAVILSTTGSAGFFGSSEVKALGVLETETNVAGGVRGRPIHFNALDDQSNPQVTVQLMNQLVAKNVPVVLGPITPPACFAIAPLIAKAGPLSFCLNPTAQPVPGGFQYAPFPDFVSGAETVLRYLRATGATRIAFLNATDGAGQAAVAAFNAAQREPAFHDIVKVDEELYNTADVSVAAQIAKIKNSGAQAIISWNVGLPFGTVLRGMNDAGLDIPIVTTGGNMTFAQMQAYASFLPSNLLFQGSISWAPGSVGPGPILNEQMAYVAGLKKAGLRPEAPYATIWDPAVLVIDAYRKLGADANADAMRAYFQKLHGWTGTDGVYDFISYPGRGLGQNAMIMFRYDKAKNAFLPAGKRGGAR